MNKLFISLIIMLVLVAGFFVLKSMDSSAPGAATSQTAIQPKVFDLVVQGRKLVSGPSTLSVKQGDSVVINITVDEDEELHLHGYDIHTDLEKGRQGSLSFVANTAGHFSYELEHSSTEIGALEVQP